MAKVLKSVKKGDAIVCLGRILCHPPEKINEMAWSAAQLREAGQHVRQLYIIKTGSVSVALLAARSLLSAPLLAEV